MLTKQYYKKLNLKKEDFFMLLITSILHTVVWNRLCTSTMEDSHVFKALYILTIQIFGEKKILFSF